MHRRLFIGAVLLLSGCSTIGITDLFQDYATQLRPVRQAVSQNNIENAQQLLPSNSRGHSNYLLNQLETARLEFLAKQNSQANETFETVYQNMEKKRQAAKIQLSTSLEQTNSLLTNDSVIGYEPAAYEMTMLHSYKALSYVFDNQLESALVEVRRANKVQEDALKDNQAVLDEQAENAAEGYPDMAELIGNIKNGFQNAFTFYLSGLLYEADKQFDDAYIDYKKALEINSDNSYLQQTVLRLAKKQGFEQDFEEFSKRFGELKQHKPNTGQVIVIAEQGLIPARQEFQLRLPIYSSHGDARFYSIAMPVYRGAPYVNNDKNITLDGDNFILKPIVRLEALAAKTLKDQSTGRITRQVMRLVAKEKMRAELARSGGDVGNILANIYNMASEQADTRSWLTLPSQLSIAQNTMTTGEHVLSVPGRGEINFSVSKQGLTLIFLTSINSYYDTHVVQL
ncbi:adenine DNA methylase [Pseudoalteromonas sp. APAL1]|uniref:COG3014 family protein n=1 Tax=Pseudoalteromonas TaxID=53246 RepID=UPI000EEBDC94|nr:adenine DNA methylase [Pseudoalteromonas sp. APAL1]MCF2920217.1 adenine DNA methylase [Pseudoalteromonas sp. APAL1]HCV04607.1 adenine DNA methylase [Pseudoalteromonas sp.]